MDTKEILRKFEDTVSGYLQELDRFTLEQLLWKPTADEWSLGQMYMHLIQSAQFMQLRNVALCLSPKDDPAVSSTRKTKQGENLFAAGSFPPDRIHVPASPQYTPTQPGSKEQLADGLRDTVRRMVEIEPAVASAVDQMTPAQVETGYEAPVHLVDHPRLGGLNALEWFCLVEMHYRHHLHQKKRLDDAWIGRAANRQLD